MHGSSNINRVTFEVGLCLICLDKIQYSKVLQTILNNNRVPVTNFIEFLLAEKTSYFITWN